MLNAEVHFALHSGHDIRVETSIQTVDQEFGRALLLELKQVDQLRRINQEDQQRNQLFATQHLLRGMAHEIKNPLTPIQLSIDRIREKYLKKIDDKNSDFSNYLNTINKQIQDIEHLVNEFSDFARMPKPVLKKIELSNVISRSISLHELSEPGIKFIFSKNKVITNINGDEEQLNRVFINLIKNSIESIHEKKSKNADFKGKIDVDIRSDSDYIYVTIIDNGVGFKQIDKRKMLTPYFTTKKKGTGLGLAVVTKVVNDHNGVSMFDSISNGAKVEIKLPKYYE